MHYGRLERETKMLGSNMTQAVRGKEDEQRMMEELESLMEGVDEGTETKDSWKKHWRL